MERVLTSAAMATVVEARSKRLANSDSTVWIAASIASVLSVAVVMTLWS